MKQTAANLLSRAGTRVRFWLERHSGRRREHDQAELAVRELEAGRAVLTVDAGDQRVEAEELLSRNGALGAGMGAGSYASGAGVEADRLGTEAGEHSAGRGEPESGVELREEELSARTRATQAGEVQVGKSVVSEERAFDVPVTHDEVTIERRPADRRAAGDFDQGDDQDSSNSGYIRGSRA